MSTRYEAAEKYTLLSVPLPVCARPELLVRIGLGNTVVRASLEYAASGVVVPAEYKHIFPFTRGDPALVRNVI